MHAPLTETEIAEKATFLRQKEAARSAHEANLKVLSIDSALQTKKSAWIQISLLILSTVVAYHGTAVLPELTPFARALLIGASATVVGLLVEVLMMRRTVNALVQLALRQSKAGPALT